MSWHWDKLTSAGDGTPLVRNDAIGLASHVFDAERTQHVFYCSVDNHIIELWWRGADAVHPGDLMQAAGGKAPLAASAPASHVFAAEGTQHVFYRTTDGQIIELWWRGGEAPHWGSLMTPNAPPAVGNLASHVFAVENSQHVFYRTRDGHIIELWWLPTGVAQPQNLNIESGAPLASSDPTSHVFDAEGTQHVFYTSIDFDIIEVWWRRGERKQFTNLSKRSGGAPPSAGRPTSHVFAAEGTQHVFYTSVESHVVELRWGNGQFPPWRDLQVGLSGALDDSSRPTSLVFSADGADQQVFYSGTDLDIRRLGLQGEEKPSPQDLMIASGGAPRAIGDPISHVFAAEGTQHVFYTTSDGYVVELWWQKD